MTASQLPTAVSSATTVDRKQKESDVCLLSLRGGEAQCALLVVVVRWKLIASSVRLRKPCLRLKK